jgi:hypothetical protein
MGTFVFRTAQMMNLNEDTPVTLKLRTWLMLAGCLLSAAVYCITLKMDYDRNVDRLDNARNRIFVLEHPEHPWSKRYRENHPELE